MPQQARRIDTGFSAGRDEIIGSVSADDGNGMIDDEYDGLILLVKEDCDVCDDNSYDESATTTPRLSIQQRRLSKDSLSVDLNSIILLATTTTPGEGGHDDHSDCEEEGDEEVESTDSGDETDEVEAVFRVEANGNDKSIPSPRKKRQRNNLRRSLTNLVRGNFVDRAYQPSDLLAIPPSDSNDLSNDDDDATPSSPIAKMVNNRAIVRDEVSRVEENNDKSTSRMKCQHKLRGSLTNLRGNLVDKAYQLSDLLAIPPSDSDLSNTDATPSSPIARASRGSNLCGSLTSLGSNLAEGVNQFAGDLMLKHPPTTDDASTATSAGSVGGGEDDQAGGSLDGHTYTLEEPSIESILTNVMDGVVRRRSELRDSDMWSTVSHENSTITADCHHHGSREVKNENDGWGGGGDGSRNNENNEQPACRCIDEENQQQHVDDDDALEEQSDDALFERAMRNFNNVSSIDDVGNSQHRDLRRSSGKYYYRPGLRTMKRCIGVFFALAVIVMASALVGSYVFRENDSNVHNVYVPIPPNNDTIAKELLLSENTIVDTIVAGQEGNYYGPEELFQMAKSVDEHCQMEQLLSATGRWECRQICHDHLCCFYDLLGDDDGHSEQHEDCRNDESRLCMIFAGCELLALAEIGSGSGNSSADADGVVVKEEMMQGTTDFNNNGANSDEGSIIGQEEAFLVSSENDFGWLEIREKYIRVYCEESHVKKTKAGRKQCEKVCENHLCCFDTTEDGRYSCRDDKSMTCDAYSACRILAMGDELVDDDVEEEHVVPDDAAGEPDLNNPDFAVYNEEGIPLPPEVALQFLPPPPPGVDPDDDVDILEPTPPGEDVPSNAAPGTTNDDSTMHAQQHTKQELLELKADVKQRCGDYRDPVGRLHCEEICSAAAFCCFSDEDRCRNDPSRLCDIFDMCKVLRGTSSPIFGDNKDENRPSQQVGLITHELEQELMNEGEGDSDNVAEASAGQDDDAPKDNGKDTSNHDQAISAAEQASIVETPNPTPKPTPSPTPAPLLPSPPPPPPAHLPTSPPVAPVQSNNAAKLPPPPPIRCIPEGDDEIHTEVYSDDWNDDRYNRCKRWEDKHGMTIGKYWDLHGIDSELEKNVLENMLIKDNAKIGAGKEGQLPPPFDPDNLETNPLHPTRDVDYINVNPPPPLLDLGNMDVDPPPPSFEEHFASDPPLEPPPREDNLGEESLDDLDDEDESDDDMLRVDDFDDGV